MLNLVGMVASDLAPERALDVVARRALGQPEQLVVGLKRFWFLNAATFDAGSSRCLRAANFLAALETVLDAQYGQKSHPGWRVRPHVPHP